MLFLQHGSGLCLPSPVQLTAQIQFVKPLAKAGIAPYNPFIFDTYRRGKEVHLVDHAPTEQADLKLFGAGADTSDPSQGRYYRAAGNIMWALDIPDPMDYPVETKDLSSVYDAFGTWAESSGKKALDWFLNPSMPEFTYHKPSK